MTKGGRQIKPVNRLDDATQKDAQIAVRKNRAPKAENSVDTLAEFSQNAKTKRPLFLVAFCNSLILMVPEAGIEPARRERRGILNPLCLPISPLGHRNRYQARAAGLSIWRHVPESNRTKRICNPLHNRFANAPCKRELALYCLNLERETRLELATPTLARSCSTN